MALLKALYDTKDDIPDGFDTLYAERDGKFELTEVEGFKTEKDVSRVQEALRKEKGDHKETKGKLAAWHDLDPEETREALDKIPELEAQVGDGKIDETKMNELVEGRLKTRMAPIERELATAKKDLGDAVVINDKFAEADSRRKIHDSIRVAATDSKILLTAMDDALMLGERIFEIREDDGAIVTKDNVGVTPGVKAPDWLAEIQDKRPHWWEQSAGGGAGGAGGSGGFTENPWTPEHWNITKQGAVVTSKGMETAERMAKTAGSSIGATSPKKTAA